MIDESPNINSADKILEAATKLFAMDSFALPYPSSRFLLPAASTAR